MAVERESRYRTTPAAHPIFPCMSIHRTAVAMRRLTNLEDVMRWGGNHGRSVFRDDLGPKLRLDGIVHLFVQ